MLRTRSLAFVAANMARIDPSTIGHGREFADPRTALDRAEGVYCDRAAAGPADSRMPQTPQTNKALQMTIRFEAGGARDVPWPF